VDEYRRVRVTGRYLNDEETLVQALTERGAGYWVMTPLLAKGGFTVLVNRGFVPADRNTAASRSAGMVMGDTTVSGLLRLSEPHGGFLHVNQPAAGRWYSRDVPAMAASLQLHNVAPYFIDADAAANAGGFPVGGLTVVSFRNQHLQYALTWFSLAILSVVGAMVVARQG
jgi:surfeit locus 1 family protein